MPCSFLCVFTVQRNYFLICALQSGILALIMIQNLEKIESVTNVSDFSSIRNSVTVFIKDLQKQHVAKNAEVHYVFKYNRNRLASR